MTAISPTEAEPLCDIEAQIEALLKPEHPKEALWISDGTEFVMIEAVGPAAGLHCLDLPGMGTFYGTEHACGRLEDEPTEERLAELLGYIEPKSQIIARPAVWWPVVQAHAFGGVVWEQISSWEQLGWVMRRAIEYGSPKVMTMDEVLHRRKRLIEAEKRNAKRVEGREGREQAEARIPR